MQGRTPNPHLGVASASSFPSLFILYVKWPLRFKGASAFDRLPAEVSVYGDDEANTERES